MLNKQALLEWLNIRKNEHLDSGLRVKADAFGDVAEYVQSGAFDADDDLAKENERLKIALFTHESYDRTVDDMHDEIQRLRAALELCSHALKNGYFQDELILRNALKAIDQALSTTEPTGAERVRECPDHPDEKPQISSSHTWTQDGNTYFVSYVEYCPTCYHVISTSARL